MATEVVIKKSELRQRGAQIKNIVSLINNSHELGDDIEEYAAKLEATVSKYLEDVRASQEAKKVSHE